MNSYQRNSILVIFSLLIVLVISACERNIGYEKLTGQLIGNIQLVDEKTNLVSDNSGVEIVVEGSNPEIKVYTDKKGQYIINDLETGIYNIIFNKEGYGQYKIIGFQFVGGNKPASTGQRYLYKLVDFKIENVQISTIDNSINPMFLVTAHSSISRDNPYPMIRYYLSDEPNVSYNNYISTTIDYLIFNAGECSFSLSIDTLIFPTGSDIYLVLYPATENWQYYTATESSQYYTDIESGNKIYTSVNINNPSNIAGITIPKF
jgi:hypothetical protein